MFKPLVLTQLGLHKEVEEIRAISILLAKKGAGGRRGAKNDQERKEIWSKSGGESLVSSPVNPPPASPVRTGSQQLPGKARSCPHPLLRLLFLPPSIILKKKRKNLSQRGGLCLIDWKVIEMNIFNQSKSLSRPLFKCTSVNLPSTEDTRNFSDASGVITLIRYIVGYLKVWEDFPWQKDAFSKI